jgi:hypothetical protein
MIMKKPACLLVVALAFTSAFAQTAPSFPDWKATLKVVDENGQPVPSANAEIWYQVQPPPNQTERSEKIAGLTDTNGIFTATHAYTAHSLSFRAAKLGYYAISIGHQLGFDYNRAKWNPAVTLVLKQVRSPIPMYAKFVNSEPPANDKAVGFDLMAGDWVAPYGRGQRADVLFVKKFAQRSRDDYDYSLVVSFANANDGIQTFVVPEDMKYCELRSPHEAPQAGYEPQVTKTNISHPPETVKWNYDPSRNYFFRVRTVLDEKGNVKSALYGKIYGDFMQFRYYLNPTPNDRNVEFDPKRNLLTHLRSTEEVDAP